MSDEVRLQSCVLYVDGKRFEDKRFGYYHVLQQELSLLIVGFDLFIKKEEEGAEGISLDTMHRAASFEYFVMRQRNVFFIQLEISIFGSFPKNKKK